MSVGVFSQPPQSCTPAALGAVSVIGASGLLGWDNQVPSTDPRSSRSPFVLDSFLLQVTGHGLNPDRDMISVVPANVSCGTLGAAASSPFLLSAVDGLEPNFVTVPSADTSGSLGQPSTVGQLAAAASAADAAALPLGPGLDASGAGESLLWSNLSMTASWLPHRASMVSAEGLLQ